MTKHVVGHPGLGRLVYFAIMGRDIPLVQANTMLVVAIYAVANLTADISPTPLNPRIRYH